MKIVRQCSCGRTESLDLTEKEWAKYQAWRNGECYIQDIGTLNAVEREFIKTGYCPECQENIFGNGKTDRVKKVDK